MSLGKSTLGWLNLNLAQVQATQAYIKMIIDFRGRIWENCFYCPFFKQFWEMLNGQR